MKTNPYIVGNSVGGSSAFIGRSDVLIKVNEVIRHPNQNIIALHGQRRIGKTSILKQLEATLNEENEYHAVFFDLLGRIYQPLNLILTELAIKIKEKVTELSSPPEIHVINDFHIWLFNGLSHTKPLILLLDEFEALESPQHQSAPNNFFNYLHDHLINQNNKKFNLVFTIGRNISDLQNIALSALKGVLTRKVTLLNKVDTKKLICLSEKNQTLYWEDEAVNSVWSWTQGHPFLTQLLCSRVWEYFIDNTKTGRVTVEDVDNNLGDTLELAEAALQWLWRGMPPHEKIVAATIASFSEDLVDYESLKKTLQQKTNITVVEKLLETLDSLKKWDFLSIRKNTNDEDAYFFKVRLIRRWIKENQLLEYSLKEIDHTDPKAHALYDLALLEYQAIQYESALNYLDQALELNSLHVGANMLYAETLYKQGKIDESINTLNKFYQFQPAQARIRLVDLLKEKVFLEENFLHKFEFIRSIYSIYQEGVYTDPLILEQLELYIADLRQNQKFEDAINIYLEFGLDKKAKDIIFLHKYAIEFEKFTNFMLTDLPEIDAIFIYDIEDKKLYSSNSKFNSFFLSISINTLELQHLLNLDSCAFVFSSSCIYMQKNDNFLCACAGMMDIPLALLKSKISNTKLFSYILHKIIQIKHG